MSTHEVMCAVLKHHDVEMRTWSHQGTAVWFVELRPNRGKQFLFLGRGSTWDEAWADAVKQLRKFKNEFEGK